VLHQVGPTLQAPVDTVLAGPGGKFDVRFRSDTSALFLLSVRYQGIEYFSAPIRGLPGKPDTSLVIIVADTSSAAPVSVAERTLLVGRPDQSHSRMVIDWLVLSNPGERTRVSPDSSRATWSVPLPEGVQQVSLADASLSQFSPDAVGFRGDSVQVFAPISPGRKELVLQYRIAGGLQRVAVPAPGTDSVFVLLEEPEAGVEPASLIRTEGQQIEGRAFGRWGGVLGSAREFTLVLPGPGLSSRVVLPVLLGTAILAFFALALARARGRAVPVETPDPIALADRIARLDQERAEAGAAWPPERDAAYRAERARLKAQLERALATPPRRS